MNTLRESYWIVVTHDGLFLSSLAGDVSQEYPDAVVFARESLARRAAKGAGSFGPYDVVSCEDYAAGVQS